MYFTGIMKLNLRVIRFLRIEEPFALGQVNRMTILILGRVGLFEAQEVMQFAGILTGQPAGFIKRK